MWETDDAADFGVPETPARSEWTAERVIDFLDKAGARVVIKSGSPAVVFPEHTPAEIRDAILPHLGPVRGLLIDHYCGTAAKPENEGRRGEKRAARLHKEQTGETPAETRARLVREARESAARFGKPLLFLCRNGMPVDEREAKPHKRTFALPGGRKRKVSVPLDRHATHVTKWAMVPPFTQPQGEWLALPKVTTADEDLAFRPPKGKKKGRDYGDH